MVAIQATAFLSSKIASYADKPDYAAHFPEALLELKGEPNWKLSKKGAEWRYGTHGSFSADLIKGCWHDHENSVGGGVLDFIARELKCDPAAAGKWFEQKYGNGTSSGQPPVSGALAIAGHRHEAQPPHHKAPTTWEPDHVVAIYDYRDETGELLFQVLRIEKPGEKKTFSQRHPVAGGKWVYTQTCRQVPYRLPQLQERPEGAAVWVFEGEKDADRVAALGFVATCNPGGGNKWPDELTEHFRGLDVRIIADNDEPGHKHAQLVATKLHGIADQVKVIALPGVKLKGDVSDWLDAGRTGQDLVELADKTPAWEPGEPDSSNPFKPEDLATLLQGPIQPRGWLLGTQLCRQYVTVLAASGGSGKTALSIAWALSLATGRQLVGLPVHKRCRVLVLTYEDGRAEYQRRLKAACLHHRIDPNEVGDRFLLRSLAGAEGTNTFAKVDDRGAMRETEAAGQISDIIERYKVDVVMVDPFIKCSGAPENDNVAVDFVARILTRLAENHNVAVLVSHHFRKAVGAPGDIESARGARSLIDAARIAATLSPMSTEEADKFGVPEAERQRLVRLDDGKANLALLASARWYRLASVNIGNGTDDYPAGDNVQAVEAWSPPETWAGLSHVLLNRILDDIDKGMADGERYSGAHNASARAAWPVVQKHAPDKTKAQCREVIKTWLKNEVLKVEQYESPGRREKQPGLAVDASKRPGTEWQ